ncbi:hypothetical protein HKX48_006691 [Thoreauomyces humboldtii]|nr:hypothetical protein HKX48_006691 [Thoreauomyces humboldtii]
MTEFQKRHAQRRQNIRGKSLPGLAKEILDLGGDIWEVRLKTLDWLHERHLQAMLAAPNHAGAQVRLSNYLSAVDIFDHALGALSRGDAALVAALQPWLGAVSTRDTSKNREEALKVLGMTCLTLGTKFRDEDLEDLQAIFNWGFDYSEVALKALETPVLSILNFSFERQTIDVVADDLLADDALRIALAGLRGPPQHPGLALIVDYLAALAVRIPYFVGRKFQVTGKVLVVLALEVAGRTLERQELNAVQIRETDVNTLRPLLVEVAQNAADEQSVAYVNFADEEYHFADPRGDSGEQTSAAWIVEDWAAPRDS